MTETKFRQMKPSGVPWLGDIPEGWDAVCFKTIIAQNDGGIWGDDLYHGTGTLVLRSTEQTIDGKWTIANPAKRDLSSVNNLDYYLLKIGDLVITKSSGSPAHIGKTSIVDSSIESMNCCYSNFMQRIRLNTTAYPKFYWHVLNSTLTREQFVYLQNSTSGIGNINKSDIQKLIVPFPPLPEQRAIADFLDEKCAAIDAIVEEAKAGIEEYAKWKQSVVFQAVTKGLDPHAKMKDSGVDIVGEMPMKWDLRRLRFICSVSTGNQDTQNSVPDGQYPFFVRSPIVERSNAFTFDGMAVLMAGDGAGAGKVFHIYSGKMAIHQRVYCFHEFKDVRPKFFFYWLCSRRRVTIIFGSVLEQG